MVTTATATDPDGVSQAEHGEVFTKPWVVQMILDLVGYTPDGDLGGHVLLEPSCGDGAFLVAVVGRLVDSCVAHGRPIEGCTDSVLAFDLLDRNVERSRSRVRKALAAKGVPHEIGHRLAQAWVRQSDFLLLDEDLSVDFVVGNPPYVRIEQIEESRSAAYRERWDAMRGRADLYVGFFQRGLESLRTEGRLGFICADRWMRNQYGKGLRELVSASYSVDTVVSLHDVEVFENAVAAYPAITVLRRGDQGVAQVAVARPEFDRASVKDLVSAIQTSEDRHVEGVDLARLPDWFGGSGLWPTGKPQRLELLHELESRFAPLEDHRTGTRVGIGVATGCDEIYIPDSPPKVEADRILPLLTSADIAGGTAAWSGSVLVNPWDDDGLVDLGAFPLLSRYFTSHGERLRNRHVARKRPADWYRTIDRVHLGLVDRPKLLLPDMKAASHPVLDPGGHYPHHNLYYVISDTWDLEVLGGLLLSDVANLFVGAYCVKMRGDTFRFQAQYVRKIRVPQPDDLSPSVAVSLREAFRVRDRLAASEAAAEVYGIGLDRLLEAATA